MIPTYVTKLDLIIQKTSVRIQKNYSIVLKTYSIASAKFLIQDSLEKAWFFEKTFLLVDTSIEMVLETSFLFLSNAEIKFAEKLEKLIWRSYITVEALLILSRIELINKR